MKLTLKAIHALTAQTPPPDQYAQWQAWAALPGGLGQGEVVAAETGYAQRQGRRDALRPTVLALLAAGLTAEDVRMACRQGADLMNAADLPSPAFTTLCRCLDDLSYEYPQGSPEWATIRVLLWATGQARRKARPAQRKIAWNARTVGKGRGPRAPRAAIQYAEAA